jgi:hypothetical protein
MIDTVEGLGVADEAHVELLLVLSGLLHDPSNIGNVIARSAASAKACLDFGYLSINDIL